MKTAIDSPLIAPDEQFQDISDPSNGGKIFGEGVAAAPDGSIYITDLPFTSLGAGERPRGAIVRYDPSTGVTSTFLEPSDMAIGLVFDCNGDLLAAHDEDGGTRNITRTNLKTGIRTVVADNYRGDRFVSPNDLTTDAMGRVYFTDSRFTGSGPIELPNAVYRVDLDGTVTQIITDVYRPNGIHVSPDGKKLYVAAYHIDAASVGLAANPNGPARDADNMIGGVIAYDLDPAGDVSTRKVIYRRQDMGVDGMTMDVSGNLYLAMQNFTTGASLMVAISSEGLERAAVAPEPGVLINNVGFGRGADDGTLYAAGVKFGASGANWKLLKLKTLTHGFHQ
jgi:gluconolactonase